MGGGSWHGLNTDGVAIDSKFLSGCGDALPAVSVLGKWRLDDQEVQANLGYTERYLQPTSFKKKVNFLSVTCINSQQAPGPTGMNLRIQT